MGQFRLDLQGENRQIDKAHTHWTSFSFNVTHDQNLAGDDTGFRGFASLERKTAAVAVVVGFVRGEECLFQERRWGTGASNTRHAQVVHRANPSVAIAYRDQGMRVNGSKVELWQ